MSATFAASEEDFCVYHGRDFMRTEAGNPIAFCMKCETELCEGLQQEDQMDDTDTKTDEPGDKPTVERPATEVITEASTSTESAFRTLTTTDDLVAAHAALADTARSLGLIVDTETNFVAVETGQKACERLLAKIEAKRGAEQPGALPAKARKPRAKPEGQAPKTKAAGQSKRTAGAAQPAAKPISAKEDDVSTSTTTTSKTKSRKAKTAKTAKAKKPVKAKVAKAAKAKSNGTGARHGSKTEGIAKLLARASGCTAKEVLALTGWPSVSMPALAKNIGVKLHKEKEKGSVTRYYGK